MHLQQFIDSLIQSGLMSAAEVALFQQGLPPGKEPEDIQALARELIQAGKLTKYQAQAIYQGKAKTLVFDEYVVLDKLGEGGMGVVLKARHKRMDRLVAIKILPSKAMKAPDAVQRFYREVKAAAKLSHPNIVAAYDAREFAGTHCLVMEYVEGKDLSQTVKECGPLELKQALDCILQAARGLEYAHGQGVIHRDIKPANLLLDNQGRVKILDMGLARISLGPQGEPDRDRLTESSQVMGTCDYMAPEQAENAHQADHRADIYSLGCTLYRFFTGKSPFVGESLVQVLMAHRTAPIPSLRSVRPEVPEAMDAVFQRMMAKRPEERYQSMSEVIADLEAHLGSSTQPFTARLLEERPIAVLPQTAPSRQGEPVAGTATNQRQATLADDTLRHVARTDTGTGIIRKAKGAASAACNKLSLTVAIAGVAAALVAAATVVHIAADKGEVIIRSSVRGGQVLFKQSGKVSHQMELEQGESRAAIRSGDYEVVLSGVDTDGLSLKNDTFTLSRGGTVTVEITRNLALPSQLMPSTALSNDTEAIQAESDPLRHKASGGPKRSARKKEGRGKK